MIALALSRRAFATLLLVGIGFCLLLFYGLTADAGLTLVAGLLEIPVLLFLLRWHRKGQRLRQRNGSGGV